MQSYNKTSASYFIKKLHLEPHPEGGYYSQIYQDKSVIKKVGLSDKFDGNRSCSTVIYFLLDRKNFSTFHRIKSDEGWHYYAGNTSVKIYEIKTDGKLIVHNLGNNIDKGEKFFSVVEKNAWFGAELGDQNDDNFALVGCSVAPGFDYKDFEMATFGYLSEQYPQHIKIIEKLTRK
nr:13593_t:CDS:1 [Entrophospora candida]CAG8563410.1 2001_t:CDS:1 [Entrophospora candida]